VVKPALVRSLEWQIDERLENASLLKGVTPVFAESFRPMLHLMRLERAAPLVEECPAAEPASCPAAHRLDLAGVGMVADHAAHAAEWVRGAGVVRSCLRSCNITAAPILMSPLGTPS
jgi:hypothetical protein